MKPTQLTGQCNSHIHYLENDIGIHKDMLNPWLNLVSAAQKDNIDIAIASGFRSFERQASIWNRKYLGELPIKDITGQVVNIATCTELEKIQAILLYSALPGASRHHWGSDIDIYSPALLPSSQRLQLEPWEYETSGYFNSLTTWLKKYAKSFGFYFPYASYQGGVAVEPWHLSYAPIANNALKALNLDELTHTIAESQLLGKNIILENLPNIYTQYINNITEYS